MVDLLIRLGSLDRRWVFLVIGIAVTVPLLLGFGAPLPTTKIVQDIYDHIEALPEGSRVLISFDYGPGTEIENQPMAEAIMRHCMERGHRIILMALWATGPPQIQLATQHVFEGDQATHLGKVYGEDYLDIGFKAGNQGVINSILNDFSFFNSDAREGRPLPTFPMMEGVRSLRDIDLIIGIGSGRPGLKEWVQFGGDQGDVPVGGGVTAVEAPLLYPYYPTQLLGLMGGLQGAAEYETALMGGYPRLREMDPKHLQTATSKMGPQTVAHIMIVLFVVIGNISMFLAKRKGA
jgi:hypothetical protein